MRVLLGAFFFACVAFIALLVVFHATLAQAATLAGVTFGTLFIVFAIIVASGRRH